VKRLIILTVALFSLGSASAQAGETTPQDSLAGDAATDNGKSCAVCLRGRQKPRCGSFLITEITLLYPLTGGNMSGADYPLAVGYELGAMVNIDKRSAVGLTGFAMLDGHEDRLGIKSRYRRWLSPHLASDVGAGVVLTNESSDESKWLVGSLGLSWDDRLHVIVEYVHGNEDLQHYGYAQGSQSHYTTTRKIRKLYAGIKVGGEAGALLGLAGGVIGGIAALIALSSFGDGSTFY